VHELSDGRVVDGLGGRDQTSRLGADSGEHALELAALGHLRRAAARLDVLVDNGQAELIRFALDDRASSRLDTVEGRRLVIRKKVRREYSFFQCVIEGVRVCVRHNCQ
jgi:hypothetical protein